MARFLDQTPYHPGTTFYRFYTDTPNAIAGMGVIEVNDFVTIEEAKQARDNAKRDGLNPTLITYHEVTSAWDTKITRIKT